MTTDEAVLLAVVVFIIVAGIWLAGLTYLMWRAHVMKTKAPEAEEPAEETSSPGQTKSA
jgi:threonine/homoserine/homoserine lactone efflux protein